MSMSLLRVFSLGLMTSVPNFVDSMFKKWEIYEVIYTGVNKVMRAILNSMYFPLKTRDQAWDLLEQLGWDSYEHENLRENSRYPTSAPSIFHAKCYSYYQCRDPYVKP